MSSINSVCISGNLGSDPELRQTKGGTSVLTLSMAVNERVKDPQTQQWSDRPNWVRVTVWGNRAEALSRILAKGSKVAIQGRLHESTWEKDGQTHHRLDVTANEVELLGSANGQQQGAAPKPQTSGADVDVADYDLPF